MHDMISGLGIDMIRVERIAGSMGKERGLMKMGFSVAEVAYREPKTNKLKHYAARFAAREAFLKHREPAGQKTRCLAR